MAMLILLISLLNKRLACMQFTTLEKILKIIKKIL